MNKLNNYFVPIYGNYAKLWITSPLNNCLSEKELKEIARDWEEESAIFLHSGAEIKGVV